RRRRGRPVRPGLGRPAAPVGRLLVRDQGVVLPVRLHLAARHLSALPLRSADGSRLEVAPAAVDRQRAADRPGDRLARQGGRVTRALRTVLLAELWVGLWTTLKNQFRPHVTVEYPKETVELSPRFRGTPRLRFDPATGEELCIACHLCEQVCPDD